MPQFGRDRQLTAFGLAVRRSLLILVPHAGKFKLASHNVSRSPIATRIRFKQSQKSAALWGHSDAVILDGTLVHTSRIACRSSEYLLILKFHFPI